MSSKQKLFFILSLLVCLNTVEAKVVAKDLVYKVSNVSMKGYLAYDDSVTAKRPGVLVVHEWWGNNEYAHKRARMLAELGYVAFALDMYGEGKVATNPTDAKAFSSAVRKDWALTQARFNAGMDVLRQQPNTDSRHLAAIGYCFGGGIVLDMARAGTKLDAMVSFHGSLASALQVNPGQVMTPLLVLHGKADAFVKPEDVAAFEKSMQAAGANYRLIQYEGATHAFTNPDSDRNGKEFGMPIAYNAKADKASWQVMQSFLRDAFK